MCSTVSRIEAGTLGERFAAACDEAFLQDGWLVRPVLPRLAVLGRATPPWFRNWVETERHATVIRWWEPLLIPGLLQTEGYARAVLGWGPDDGHDLDERVAARLERQGIFGRDVPPEVWILIGEPVLGYCVGSADIMRKQLEYLAEMAARPRVTIQVISASAGAYGGLSGAFAIGTDSTADSVVYLETGIRGVVVRDPRLITRAVSVFDHLRAEALPRSQTLDILAKAGEKWNG